MSSWKCCIKTSDGFTSLPLRLTLGVVMFPHGMQKVAGWFGGGGFEATMGWMTESMGFPWIIAFCAVLAESIGAVMLITGFFTRIAALTIGITMAVAAYTVHRDVGFFMNWHGNLQGEGYEFHILAIGMSLALVLFGGGAWSIDRYLYTRD